MEFFTLDWWMGVQSGSTELPADHYQQHLGGIRQQIPASLYEAETNAPLHDARLRDLQVDLQHKTLRIHLEAWDNDGAEIELRLEYSEVQSIRQLADPSKGLPGPDGFGDLGYTEAHFLDGLPEHRLLFSSGIEMRVRFVDLRVEAVAKSP